jgi:DNA (cytosine-5)-methyltransferase 1
MARVIREVRPRYTFIENSPMLTSRGLDRVLCDLAEMGFNVEWGVIGAHHAGAPHKRDRIWIVASDANSDSEPVVAFYDEAPKLSSVAADAKRVELRDEPRRRHGTNRQGATQLADDGTKKLVADANRAQRERNKRAVRSNAEHADACGAGWWQTEPDVGRVADGVASRMDRLKCIGNGQVPSVAELAWRTLIERLAEKSTHLEENRRAGIR